MNHCYSKRSSIEAQCCRRKGQAGLSCLLEWEGHQGKLAGKGFGCVAKEGLGCVCVSPLKSGGCSSLAQPGSVIGGGMGATHI